VKWYAPTNGSLRGAYWWCSHLVNASEAVPATASLPFRQLLVVTLTSEFNLCDQTSFKLISGINYQWQFRNFATGHCTVFSTNHHRLYQDIKRDDQTHLLKHNFIQVSFPLWCQTITDKAINADDFFFKIQQ